MALALKLGNSAVSALKLGAVDVTAAYLGSISLSVGGGAVTITSDGAGATASLSEAEGSTEVTTVVATQAEPSGAISYSITGGADAALFTIGASRGVLVFLSAPAFATPLDANADNVYEVEVTATGRGGLSDTQAISDTILEGGGGGGDWLLQGGIWNDAGLWDDGASWEDAA